MTSKLKISVIGGGGISHAHLPYLKRCGDTVELVGIADANVETARATAGQYEIPRAVTDFRDLLPFSDAVVICVPTHLHAPIAIEALSVGKHVFCEKPIARTIEQANAMIEAAQRSGAILQIGLVRRFDEQWLSMKNAVQAGSIGSPVTWRHVNAGPGPSDAAWFYEEEKGGGPFLDGCIHNIDFALDMFGPAEWVFGHGRTMRQNGTAVDTGTATIHFASDDELLLAWSWGLPQGVRAGSLFDLIGPCGAITWPGPESLTAVAGREGETHFTINNGESTEQVWYPDNALTLAYERQMQDFVEAAQNVHAPRAGYAEGTASLKVALAILESMQTGQVVAL